MTETSVVVVGGGLAGLTAARALHRRGVDVLVLEAAARLGGRAMSETSALASRLDLGGQWIGHDHHRVANLADELGAVRFPMHTGALPRVVDGPRRVRLLSPAMLVTIAVLLGVAVLSRVGTPARWNTVTLDECLQRVRGRRARSLLEQVALISWTADTEQLSVHAMTRLIRRQGGLRTILSTRGGAQEALLVDGVEALVTGLSDELGPRVRTGRRVTAILQDAEGVTVRTGAGDVRAAKAIMTVPPPMAARIAHEPPLPPARAELERTTYMGSVYKAIAVFEQPFWRARNGGEFIVLDGPGCAVFDTSPPGGPGHLCILVGGSRARALDALEAAARREALLGPLVPHVGAEVLIPASWHEKSWHLDEFVGGGYVALPYPGTTAGLPPVASAPIGHLHWAGAETADDHPGYLDGAIESGERAAAEVIDMLAAELIEA